MRFIIIAFFMSFALANITQAPKPYEKEGVKVEVGGELLLRYEKQSTKSNTLKRSPKRSQGSLKFSIE